MDGASTQVVNGRSLAVTLTDSSVIDYSRANFPAGDAFFLASASSSQSTLSVQCFAEGKRIGTCGGAKKVEDLAIGDMVPTCLDGAARRIV